MKKGNIFCIIIFSILIGISIPSSVEAYGSIIVQGDNYSILYNSDFGCYELDYYGESGDELLFCMAYMKLFYNSNNTYIININNNISVKNCIVLDDGNYYIYGNGHIFYNNCQTYIFVALDDILKVRGNACVNIFDLKFDGRGLCYSAISNLPGALIDLDSGSPNLMMKRCVICNAKNNTIFDNSEPLGGGTGINAYYGNLYLDECSFSNLSGASLYEGGVDNMCGQCNITLLNSSSINVSSIYTSGNNKCSCHRVDIIGGNYKCGNSGGEGSEYITYALGLDIDDGKNTNINVNLFGTTIESVFGYAIHNNGNLEINNNTLIHNAIVGIENEGIINIYDLCICDNLGFGIINNGIINHFGGEIINNHGITPEGYDGGVEQNGLYTCGSNALIYNNSLYLKGDNVVNLTDKCNEDISYNNNGNKYNILITMDLDKRYVGKEVCVSDNISFIDRNEDLIKLSFNNPKYNDDMSEFTGVLNSAILRNSTRFNSDEVGLFLSARYKLNYLSGVELKDNKIEFSKEYDEFYWKEGFELDFNDISYSISDISIDVSKSIKIIGFTIDGIMYYSNNKFAVDSCTWNSNKEALAIWDVIYDIRFDANGGCFDTNGNKKYDESDLTEIIYDNLSGEFTIPSMDCIKETSKSTRINMNTNKDEEAIYKYSIQGYNSNLDGKYKGIDDNTYINGEIIEGSGTIQYIIDSINDENAISKDGKVVKTYYCIWDEYPMIDCNNIIIPIDRLNSFNKEELLILSKVKISDYEDGFLDVKEMFLDSTNNTLEQSDVFYNGEGNVLDKSTGNDCSRIRFDIENFDIDEIKNLEVGEEISINIIALDGANNISKKACNITIASNDSIDKRFIIRYIDKDNFLKDDENSGSLMKNSKWYKNDILNEEIRMAL